MKRYLFSGVALLTMVLSGCSTSQEEILPTNGTSMMGIWQQKSDVNQALYDARKQLQRGTLAADTISQSQRQYTRTAETEILSQFPRLSNPDLVIYIYPHLNGSVPVPGYTTVVPFYSHTQYAQPGEKEGGY